MLTVFLLSVGAFVLGSVPFGRLIGSLAGHIDIRKVGSGNIGATNVARHLGLRWGLLTLALDMLKGLGPVLVAEWLSPPDRAAFVGSIVGLAALAGHQFSLFQGFSGGKGVATALGVFLAISPPACLVGLGVFVALVLKWRFISLGSLGGTISIPIMLLLLGHPSSVLLVACTAALLICLRHRGNIGRMLRGEEPKWGGRSSRQML